CTREAWDFW
nr:immunoglobulin heavy chain junction region [Mus musculus]